MRLAGPLAGALALAFAASATTPAAAGDPGAAIAAGIGGFALGALAGSSARPAPPPPPPAYYGAPAYYPAPAYEEAPPPYRCWRERRPVYDEYGVVIGSRRVRVCE
ncbi:hypothetical protein Ms3S1_18020 [Methylosinus sp. 3S-1]